MKKIKKQKLNTIKGGSNGYGDTYDQYNPDWDKRKADYDSEVKSN